jgi:hypothetical protein
MTAYKQNSLNENVKQKLKSPTLRKDIPMR